MKSQTLRLIIPLLLLVVAAVCFIVNASFGNLSAIGWEDISILCPLGALGTMIASRTLIPRAVLSVVFAIVGILVAGRVICGWVCPVPVISKLRTAFSRKQATIEEQIAAEDAADVDKKLPTDEELKLPTTSGCAACGKACSKEDQPANSRYIVLAVALISAAIFGFPVFCLVCPIGLTFGLIFVLVLLFSCGDVTLSAIVIPVLLLVEVVFFRKWCTHICPLSALMSLIAKGNRFFRPRIDDNRCIEAKGGTCGRCARVCEVDIDPRHPELGANMSECIKCHKCVEICPSKALKMPVLPGGTNTKAAAKKEG